MKHFALTLLLACSFFVSTSSASKNGEDEISRIVEWRNEVGAEFATVQAEVHALVEVQAHSESPTSLAHRAHRLSVISETQKELKLRKDFLGRLVIHSQHQWKNKKSLNVPDLLQTLLKQDVENGHHELVLFLTNAIYVIEEISEQRDSAVEILRDYSERSAVATPMNPEEYLKLKLYKGRSMESKNSLAANPSSN